ncbi:hypothetical protein ACHAXR_005400, partial [Thalassiosira sp. AJA248-18]
MSDAIDEEQGGLQNAVSLRNENDEGTAPPPIGGGSFLSSFMNRFHRSSNLEQGSTYTAGKWRSLAGSRRVRFASHRSDINNDEMRGIVATPLDGDQCRPMAPGARLFKNIQTEVEAGQQEAAQFLRMGSVVEEGDGLEDGKPNQMYRLQATRGAKDVGCCRVSCLVCNSCIVKVDGESHLAIHIILLLLYYTQRTLRFLSACINCGALTESSTEQNLYLGLGDPNRWLIYFFFWLFRKGWSTVIVLSVVWYYALVLIFALLIIWASEIDNDCVKVGGLNIGELENRSKFMDSFSLSWNTFSTVGYGSTYPALSVESGGNGGDARCVFISFICSLEAFVGVIFAGFIGAIFFAKVARITQRADVRFSDPLTVRFGTGVDAHLDDDEDRPQDRAEQKQEKVAMTPIQKLRAAAKTVSKPCPFPIITFRIANEQHGTLGGEIISATVKAVVLIESTKYDDQVSEDLAKQINLH